MAWQTTRRPQLAGEPPLVATSQGIRVWGRDWRLLAHRVAGSLARAMPCRPPPDKIFSRRRRDPEAGVVGSSASTAERGACDRRRVGASGGSRRWMCYLYACLLTVRASLRSICSALGRGRAASVAGARAARKLAGGRTMRALRRALTKRQTGQTGQTGLAGRGGNRWAWRTAMFRRASFGGRRIYLERVPAKASGAFG